MRVSLLTISHRQPRWVLDACAEYEKRLPRAWRFELVELKPAARTSGADPARVRADEAERLQKALPKGAFVVALDERGESPSTAELAGRVAGWQQAGRDVAFVVGGADGLDPTFRDAANLRLSLSRLTLPHGLVRVVFVEQLYRVATVLEGHPYHK